MRNEIRETKIKYSFFGLFCIMNQLIVFNSNCLYVYLIKQGPYCKKKGKLGFSSCFRFQCRKSLLYYITDHLHGTD